MLTRSRFSILGNRAIPFNDMLSISLAGGLGALVEYRMKKDQKRFGMIRKKMISPLVPN